jgi:hypothetical protein
MGSVHAILSKKHVQNVGYEALLNEVNNDLFGGYFEIEDREGGHYAIWDPAEKRCACISLWKQSPRKIGSKLPTGWRRWVWYAFAHEAAARSGGKISLEDMGLVDPHPEDFRTYRAYWDWWHEESYQWYRDEGNLGHIEHLEEIYTRSVEHIPEGLRPYVESE